MRDIRVMKGERVACNMITKAILSKVDMDRRFEEMLAPGFRGEVTMNPIVFALASR